MKTEQEKEKGKKHIRILAVLLGLFITTFIGGVAGVPGCGVAATILTGACLTSAVLVTLENIELF